MKRIFLIIMMCTWAGIVHAGDGLTLKECYDLALERSESIGIQKEYIKETEGLMLQSLSTALPKVAFAYSEKWQDLRGSSQWDDSTPEGKFTFTQPLFTGFKEFAAIAGSRHLGKQRQQELRRAKELLFIDVADAFYLYLDYQADLEVQQEIRQILTERVAELKKRESLGKSRPSEVASAESQLAQVQASMEVSKGQKAVAGQLLEFLIGRSFVALEKEPLPDGAFDLQTLAAKADTRADVVAAKESFSSYQKNITVARSSFMPTVALSGNAYTKRKGTYEGNDWDATLSVNVPVFNGLGDFGQLSQARAQLMSADLKVSQVRRKALLEIKNAYVQLEAAYKRYQAIQQAVAAADRNYRLQVEDFGKSLVNNLDVLQSLQDLQSVRRQAAVSSNDLGRGYWKLKVATGDIQ